MKRIRFGLVLFLILNINWIYATDLNIADWGAKSDGTTLSTAIIQKLIDSANNDGGGKVIIPKGRFLTGSLVMKSGVELHLEKGSVLLGSTEISDYFAISENKWKALIMADGIGDFSITGKGTIDGQGRTLALKIDSLFYAGQLDSSLYELKERRPVAHARPMIFQFVKCTRIDIVGITIRNSSTWVQSYDLCSYILINDIKVESNAYWNNDGIDILDCREVIIINSTINSSDDGICIKSYYRGPDIHVNCEKIDIVNCKVRSSASAVKLGTSSFGGFKNIRIKNIEVYDTYRSAIALECWETGKMEDITISNIKAKNTGNAVFIRLSKRPKFDRFPMGYLKNIKISDVKVEVPFLQPDIKYDFPGPSLPFFHNVFPSSVTGIPGFKVENVVLENFKITYPGGGNPAYANMPVSRAKDVPEKIADYPEFSMFGELPAWGFYVRHVNGITLKNIRLKIKNPDYRPAFVFEDVEKLVLENVIVKGDKKPVWKVVLE
ncbi:MAG: glycoside hydrolase family 28 protein [Bacteroidetes bacterium]|nr:glycoside hydrolase family 28 protein [Bacteroidota bacterium]